jgi:hypothetical protein
MDQSLVCKSDASLPGCHRLSPLAEPGAPVNFNPLYQFAGGGKVSVHIHGAIGVGTQTKSSLMGLNDGQCLYRRIPDMQAIKQHIAV